MGLRVQLLYIRTHFCSLRLLRGVLSSSTHLISSLLDVLRRATFIARTINALSRRDYSVSVTLVVLASLSLISDQGKSPILAARASRPLSAYGPVRCPRVLSFCTCLAPRVLPLPAQGIVRLTAPYITNEDATSSQVSATPGSFFPCYHDNHRIRTRPESGYDRVAKWGAAWQARQGSGSMLAIELAKWTLLG